MSGTARAVGYKAGRWVDIVSMQRALGPAPKRHPRGAGFCKGREPLYITPA